jgi:hypothetical protein
MKTTNNELFGRNRPERIAKANRRFPNVYEHKDKKERAALARVSPIKT